MIDLEGKTALITGGARGFGRAIALLFAGKVPMSPSPTSPASSVGTYFRGMATRTARAHPRGDRGARPTAVAIQADVTSAADCERMARGNRWPWPHRHPLRQRWRVLARALVGADRGGVGHGARRQPQGVWLTTKYVVPHMIERRYGKIVITSSRDGLRAEANYAHYNASKFGAIGYMKSLAIELGPLRDQRERDLPDADGGQEQPAAGGRTHPYWDQVTGKTGHDLRGVRRGFGPREPVRGRGPARLRRGRPGRAVARLRPLHTSSPATPSPWTRAGSPSAAADHPHARNGSTHRRHGRRSRRAIIVDRRRPDRRRPSAVARREAVGHRSPGAAPSARADRRARAPLAHCRSQRGLRPYALGKAARECSRAGSLPFAISAATAASCSSCARHRRRIAPGPRLVFCGQIVAATSPGRGAFPGMYREADGADEMRRAVREQIRQGADLIKVMSTGALTVEHEDVHPAQMTAEELAAMVDESHRLGFMVASHAEARTASACPWRPGWTRSSTATWATWSPRLSRRWPRGDHAGPDAVRFDVVADPTGRFPEWMHERAKRLREGARETVAAARSAGVVMAMGADAGPHGENARELVNFADVGFPNAEAIAADSKVAAEACGLGKRSARLCLDMPPTCWSWTAIRWRTSRSCATQPGGGWSSTTACRWPGRPPSGSRARSSRGTRASAARGRARPGRRPAHHRGAGTRRPAGRRGDVAFWRPALDQVNDGLRRWRLPCWRGR